MLYEKLGWFQSCPDGSMNLAVLYDGLNATMFPRAFAGEWPACRVMVSHAALQAFDLNLIKIRCAGRLQPDVNRLNNLMDNFPPLPEAQGDDVIATLGFFKGDFLRGCKLSPLRILRRRVSIDFSVLQRCPGPASVAEPLAKRRPVGAVYFAYHTMGLIWSSEVSVSRASM